MTEKYYTLGTYTPEQWIELHAELIADGNVYASVPSRQVDVGNGKTHSTTKGSYLLTEEEALALKRDERVRFINTTPEKYPDEWRVDADDVICQINNFPQNRYADPTHNYQRWYLWPDTTNQFDNVEPDINRSTHLYRMSEGRQNAWRTQGRNIDTVITDHIHHVGAGENVDIIIGDDGVWAGHVEFINSGVVGAVNPTDYIGGNVLPGDGYCDVLDVILDGPYYLDPDWFDADPDNRLETRWDGTIVPTTEAAHNWWGDSNSRSSGFDFGEIEIDNGQTGVRNYNRDLAYGSNEKWPGLLFLDDDGNITGEYASGKHGTQCAAQAYGRTHGTSYNANKWQVNIFGIYGIGYEIYFDCCKVFHQYKPVNSIFETRDPTLMSNSWGFRSNKDELDAYGGEDATTHYYFRDSGAVEFDHDDKPNFFQFHKRQQDGRFKSEVYDNSVTVALDELLEAGVIFVAAAGNESQQIVGTDHPNYDNRIASSATVGLYNETEYLELRNFASTGTTNRRGWPGHGGKNAIQSFYGDTPLEYPVINVGALDDFMNFSTQERKVSYSDCGPEVDVYAPGDATLAAIIGTRQHNSGANVNRVDGTYPDLHARVSPCMDGRFGGTSSACPIAAGQLGVLMQYNRGYTWQNVKSWLSNSLELQPSADMYTGATEPTTADSATWLDNHALFGSARRVIYSAPMPVTTPNPNATDPPDTTAPVITILGNNPVNHERGTTYTDAGATADGGETVSVTGLGGVNVNVIGTYLIGYFATDEAGNTGSATRTVNVVDTTPPIINTTNIVNSITEGNTALGSVSCNESPVTWSIGGTDGNLISIQNTTSSPATITLNNPADFETKTSYSFTVSATDSSSNTSTVTVSISVTNDTSDDPPAGPPPDTTPPVITVTGTNPVTIERGSTYTDAGAVADGGETVTTTGTVDTNTVGSYIITYSATDAAGNTGTATRIVNVNDTNAPTIDTSSIVSVPEGNTAMGSVSCDETPVTWAISGQDSSLVTIQNTTSSTATLTLNSAADFETKTSYTFAISCTDNAGNAASSGVVVSVINDLEDDPPPAGTEIYLTKVGRHNVSTSNHIPNPIKGGEDKRGSSTDDPETEIDETINADPYYSGGGYVYPTHGTDVGANSSTSIGASGTIRIPPAYVYKGTSGFTNVNDEEMAYMELRIYPEGFSRAATTQWAVTSVVAQVLQPSGSTGYSFNFTTHTDHHRVGITNTKWPSLPYDEDYECIMEDYTTQTFDTLELAQAATDPAVLSLLNFDMPTDDPVASTIQLTVTYRKGNSSNYHTAVYTLGQNLYNNVRRYINKINTLSPAGTQDPDDLPDLPQGD
jgi:hypothetical protein